MIAAIQFIRANWIWIVIAGLCVLLGLQTIRLASEKQAHAETIAKNEQEWSTLYKNASKASQDALDQYVKQTESLQKEADNAKMQRDKANSDAVASASVGERLRKQLSETRSRVCSSPENPTTTSGSQTTTKAGDMLDYVQRRIDEATDTVARYADQAGIAGSACEKSYDDVR